MNHSRLAAQVKNLPGRKSDVNDAQGWPSSPPKGCREDPSCRPRVRDCAT